MTIPWERFVRKEIIRIEPGETVTLRFDAVFYHEHELTDPLTGRKKKVPCIYFHVIELDGKPEDRYIHFVQKRLIEQLKPYIEKRVFHMYRFRITRIGFGPAGRYELEVIPIKE